MNGKNAHSINTVFVLLIFCLFAVSSLFLVLIGANVYRSIVDKMDANNEMRSSLSYVSNKVRSADSRDVSVESLGGQETLVIASEFNSEKYNTYIYQYNGYLMELFTKADNDFKAGDGDKITPVTTFTITKNESELSLEVSGGDNRKRSLKLSLS